IAEADRRFGGLLNNQVEFLFPHGVGYRHPLPEAAATAGLALEQARRLVEAAGISEDLLQEDVEMLKQAKHAYDVGFPEDALLEIAQSTHRFAGPCGGGGCPSVPLLYSRAIAGGRCVGSSSCRGGASGKHATAADDRATNDFRASEGNGEG